MLNNDEESPYDRKPSQISALDTSIGSNDLSFDSPDSEDDSSTDEEAEAAVQDDMIMAERTSQLMTDFRSYINDIQGGMTSVNGMDAEYGEQEKPSTSGTDFSDSGAEGILMRSWNDQPSATVNNKKPYKDNPFAVTHGYGDIYNDVVLTRNPYGERSYSKKLKRCFIRTIIAGVLIAIVLSIVHSVHRRHVEENLPDWEGELAEIEEEAKHKQPSSVAVEPENTEQMSHNTQVGEGLQKPITTWNQDSNKFYADVQDLDEDSGKSSNTHSAQSISSGESAAQEMISMTLTGSTDMEKTQEGTPPAVHETQKPIFAPVATPHMTEEDFTLVSNEYSFAETYKPVWFSRNQGWTGNTYAAADAFCKSKENSMLCPYEVYCPTGPNHLPYGGIRPESTVWAPISDSKNGWVSVSGQNTCVTYMVMNLNNPLWGLTGEDNEEMTRHVMCCQDPNSSTIVDAVSVSDSSQSAIQTLTENAGASTIIQPTEISGEEIQELYTDVAKQFQPMAFTRDRGWTGQTYMSAIMFCASQESRIPCPYEVICPLGSQGVPIAGIHEGAYSPIINGPNQWVSLETCKSYSDSHSYPPLWGLTDLGDSGVDINSVVVCCDESNDRNTGIENVELDEKQKIILEEFKPTWFGREHGYLGTSYQDAEMFCKQVSYGYDLCPFEAYCPFGNDVDLETPLFPNRSPFSNEQYAPFKSINGNTYTLVGPMDNNPATTCLTYEQLHGKLPAWGSGSVELKQNILCCMGTEVIGEETSVFTGMKPTWMGAADGWNAGSYDDATTFCQSISLSLCPEQAYCPHGPSHPILGGHSSLIFGEQWAPVLGGDNRWIMIGQKYNNTATTCMTHMQLEGNSPDWGLTTDNSSAKQHILCCSL